MKFKITMNTQKFASAMKKRTNKVDNELDKALLMAGYVYQGAVKKSFPVATGYGRASVQVKGGKHFVIVGSNVKYVPYLEYGTGIYAMSGGGRQTPWRWQGSGKWKGWHTTHGMKPRKMFQNAIETKQDEIRKIIRKGLRKGLK